MPSRERAWYARIAIFNPSRAHSARDAEFCQETDFREAPETAGRIKEESRINRMSQKKTAKRTYSGHSGQN